MNMKLKLTPDRIDMLGTVLIFFVEQMSDLEAIVGAEVMLHVSTDMLEKLGVKKLQRGTSIKLKPYQALTIREALKWYRSDLLEALSPDLNALSSMLLREIDQKL